MGHPVAKLFSEPIDPQAGYLLDMIVDADEAVFHFHANLFLNENLVIEAPSRNRPGKFIAPRRR
jgi:hypothetical protein